MGSAKLLHLRNEPPLADPPDVGTQISAGGAPTAGVWTTHLMDPAPPAVGATQTVQSFGFAIAGAATYNFVYGRFLSRALPAQTIGAGNWSFYGVQQRNDTVGGAVTFNEYAWGFTVAQWRPGTGVIARFADSQSAGSTDGGNIALSADRVSLTTLAGGALTLTAGDCLVLEVWGQLVVAGGAASSGTHSLLYNGAGQYVPGVYTRGSLTDTDAYLLAPQAITFQ